MNETFVLMILAFIVLFGASNLWLRSDRRKNRSVKK